MNAALILSGGSGTRMGEDCPKQFLPIGGVPILCRTVQSFCSHPEIDCIMVVCSADMLDQTRSLLLPFHTKKPLFFASGGKTRQASSKNGFLRSPRSARSLTLCSFTMRRARLYRTASFHAVLQALKRTAPVRRPFPRRIRSPQRMQTASFIAFPTAACFTRSRRRRPFPFR